MRNKTTGSQIFCITTGDIDGIGYEVSVKALIKKNSFKGERYIIWRSPRCLNRYSRLLNEKFDTRQFSDIDSALSFFTDGRKTNPIIEVVSDENPAIWVEKSAKLCLTKQIQALITGPLSKGIILEAGLKDMGHTGILSRVTKKKSLFMTFLGSEFNVILITGHIPIDAIKDNLSLKKLRSALNMALELRNCLSREKKSLPIALIGLNPHASEGGLIGTYDLTLKRFLSSINKSKNIAGPLVPDAAFLKANWSKYSFFISLYHDQGLIPFKLVHGQDSGAHLTLGLPFIRTSVDHGTAKDIFNMDIANCNSMLDAILWASRLSSRSLR